MAAHNRMEFLMSIKTRIAALALAALAFTGGHRLRPEAAASAGASAQA